MFIPFVTVASFFAVDFICLTFVFAEEGVIDRDELEHEFEEEKKRFYHYVLSEPAREVIPIAVVLHITFRFLWKSNVNINTLEITTLKSFLFANLYFDKYICNVLNFIF